MVLTFSFALCIRNKYVINNVLFLYVAKIIKRVSQELFEVFVLAVGPKGKQVNVGFTIFYYSIYISYINNTDLYFCEKKAHII